MWLIHTWVGVLGSKIGFVFHLNFRALSAKIGAVKGLAFSLGLSTIGLEFGLIRAVITMFKGKFEKESILG